MINNLIRKAKKAPWVLGQKLTQTPSNPHAVISDLFVWRCDQDWNTYFELLDLVSLFGERGQHQVAVVFFDDEGGQFYRQPVDLIGLHRQVLDVSKILSALECLPSNYGTFCVFHQQSPSEVLNSEVFLTERGYISYQYKNAPLRSYVHGNLDAIDDSLTPLSGSSLLNRTYNLQYLLEPGKQYEVVLTNASGSDKKVVFKIISFDRKTHMNRRITLKSKQAFVLPVKGLPGSSRLIIKSKMIMARPAVFCFDGGNMDVSHG